MNPLNLTRLFALIALQGIVITNVFAQAPFGTVEPGGLTDGLISRSELRGLLDRPSSGQNPLRRPSPSASTAPANLPPQQLAPSQQRPLIHDPQLAPVGWYQETQTPELAPTAPVATDQAASRASDTEQQPSLFFGPEPSPEMQVQAEKMLLLVDYSVEKLIQEIAEHRRQLDTSLGIDQQAKTERLKQLETAELAARKATQNLSRKDGLQNQIMTFDEELQRLREQAKLAQEAIAFDESDSVEQLQTQLRNLEAELRHEKTGLSKTQDRIQQRDNRMSAIPRERLESRNLGNDLHQLLAKKQSDGNSEIVELVAIRAQELSASTNVQLLDDEAQWHDLSREKLPLQKSIHQRRIKSLEQQITSWNQQISQRKQSDLERQIQTARQAAFETHPALREFSLETSQIAQSRVDLAAVTSRLQNEKLKVEKQQHDIEQELQELEKHEPALKEGGNSESNQLLIEVHRNLLPPWQTMARIRQIERELLTNRSTKLSLRERFDEISDPQHFIRERLEITEDEPVADTTLVAMAEEAIESYRQHLLALVGDHEKVHGLLNDIKSGREETLKNIESTRKLIDTYALWVQDAAPFNVELLNESRSGAAEFFDPQQWRELGKSVVTNIRQRPWKPTVGLLGLFAAFLIGRRFQG